MESEEEFITLSTSDWIKLASDYLFNNKHISEYELGKHLMNELGLEPKHDFINNEKFIFIIKDKNLWLLGKIKYGI
jgi:hypothetical protein